MRRFVFVVLVSSVGCCTASYRAHFGGGRVATDEEFFFYSLATTLDIVTLPAQVALFPVTFIYCCVDPGPLP
jgi:hypothetical protein